MQAWKKTGRGPAGITAAVIAGGKSRRFGEDKALYPYRGVPLIGHVLAVLREMFESIAIIADDGDRFARFGYPVHPDIHTGFGSLAGIHSALHHGAGAGVFVVACDMPFLDRGLIEYQLSRRNGVDVVVPLIGGFYEPLHACYSRACLEPIEESIAAGKRQIVSFYEKVRVLSLGEEDIKKIADPGKVFRNFNYLQDIRDNSPS